MIATRLFTAALLTLALPASATTPAEPPPVRTVLIFSDVTSSLSLHESDRVGVLTESVLASLAPGTRFSLYAIQSDAEAPPYYDNHMPLPRNSKERLDAKAKLTTLRRWVRRHLSDLYCSINWNDSRTQNACRQRSIPPRPQTELRSCILRTLPQAQKAIEEASRSHGLPVELVFISDMVEECSRTPLGPSMRLTNQNLPGLTRRGGKVFIADLHHARVTVIVPRVLNGDRPATSEPLDFTTLEAFWKEIFTSAKADMGAWYFNSSLPLRMQTRH